MTKRIWILISAGVLVACSGAERSGRLIAEMPALAACNGEEIASNAQLTRYAHCAIVSGDLTLDGVNDLSLLGGVREVTGTLWIENTSDLASLAGLEKLESVDTLMLTNNRGLLSVRQLSHLQKAHALVLLRNPKLGRLEGVSHVASLDNLTLVDNGFATLVGLGGLEHVGQVVINRNENLVDLGDAIAVARADRVEIRDNPRLKIHFEPRASVGVAAR